MNRLMPATVVVAMLTAGMIGAALGETVTGVPGVDSSLVGWWKLDNEGVDVAADSSTGWHDGMLYGDPLWVPGHIGDALWFDGYDDYVDTGFYENLPVWTVSAWVTSPDGPRQGGVGGPVHRQANFQFNWNHDDSLFVGTAALLIGSTWHPASFGPLSGNQWYHLAATFDGFSLKAYTNGDLIATNPAAQGVPTWEPESLKFGRHAAGPYYFTGAVDDVRVYSRALTQAEIEALALYTPWEAQSPHPPRNGNVDIGDVNDLRWSAGQDAVMHDVYFGPDANAVETADVNAPVYWGRQVETTFPAAGLVQAGSRYFWRIDEIEADGLTIHKGIVWSFAVSAPLVVDDFESYTDDEGHRIQDTWIDGALNGTGSQVSRWAAPSVAAGDDQGNRQAMSLAYSNGRAPFYSEVDRWFVSEQDWTAALGDTLSLSVRGDVVPFGEIAPGTYRMVASGADIWGDADECRYAFKRLEGDGSISVRVESLAAAEVWARAGVMIRESLDPGSRHASMFVTPDGRRAFQNRLENGSGFCFTAHSYPGALPVPCWLRIERTGNQFTAFYTTRSTRWLKQPDDEDVVACQSPNPQTIDMPATVCIGFALSSHNRDLVATAVFSQVTMTGHVGSEWEVADIGCDHPGNAPDDLYMIVEDGAGTVAATVNPDPTVLNALAWTEWRVPLSSLPGVDFHRVKRLIIGVGGREGPVPPGSGRILIDDIRVWTP
jgi:hypothetical protein